MYYIFLLYLIINYLKVYKNSNCETFKINFNLSQNYFIKKYVRENFVSSQRQRIFRRVKSSESERTREYEDELNDKRSAVKHSSEERKLQDSKRKVATLD